MVAFSVSPNMPQIMITIVYITHSEKFQDSYNGEYEDGCPCQGPHDDEDDGGIKCHWNVGKLLPDHTALITQKADIFIQNTSEH